MSFDSNTIAALGRGAMVIADFLTIRGKDSDGDDAVFNFWTGPDNVTLNVVSASDGSTESRDYIGGGALVDVTAIVDGVGLEARSHSFGLNPLQTTNHDMVNGNNIRVAVVEMHRGLRDPDTWGLVADPQPYFLGRVDGLSHDVGGVDGDTPADATMTLAVMGNQIDLTRINPALKSDEQQRLRSGDRIRRYADAAGSYDVWWGQARS